MQTATTQPYHLASGEGQPMAWFTASFRLKASDDQIGLMELERSPGHRAADARPSERGRVVLPARR